MFDGKCSGIKMDKYNVGKMTSTSTISDVEFDRKRNQRFSLAGVWRMFADFTKNSTVHGVKYLGERRRHWNEKIFWILVFLISVTGCCVMIVNLYIDWQETPFINNENSIEIWQIPFPAVTICPQTKVDSKHLKFINGSKNFDLSRENKIKLEALSQLCHSNLDESLIELNEIVSTLQNIAPKKENIFKQCVLERSWQYCDKLFQQLMTDEGSCFTFNMLNSSEIFRKNVIDEKFVSLNHDQLSTNWSPQERFRTSNEITYPRRVLGLYKKSSGLKITLMHNVRDNVFVCSEDVPGFKVILHNPGDIPRFTKDSFFVPLDKITDVIVKPSLVTTSKGLIKIAVKRRQCFFEHEKYLKFFNVYTQSNCELECLTNFTLDACKCVKFSMPRDKVTPICSQDLVDCYNNAEIDFIKKESFQVIPNKTSPIKCECLPSCTTINYGYQIIQYEERTKISQLFKRTAKLSIFFKEPRLMTTERSEIYGWLGFIASCGGLLGLFMGVSLLSVIELIYYFTLRLACNLGCRKKLIAKINPAKISVDKIPKIKQQKPKN